MKGTTIVTKECLAMKPGIQTFSVYYMLTTKAVYYWDIMHARMVTQDGRKQFQAEVMEPLPAAVIFQPGHKNGNRDALFQGTPSTSYDK